MHYAKTCKVCLLITSEIVLRGLQKIISSSHLYLPVCISVSDTTAPISRSNHSEMTKAHCIIAGMNILRQRKIRDLWLSSSTPLIAFDTELHDRMMVEALNMGAMGVLGLDSSSKDVISTLDRVSRGRSSFLPIPDSDTHTTGRPDPRLAWLTPREWEVFELLVLRRTNTEIASTLHLTFQTVKNYSSRIYQKLDVKGRKDLFNEFKIMK